MAKEAEQGGDKIAARDNYFMAANYWASAMWTIDEVNQKLPTLNDKKRAAFDKYTALADHHIEWVELPYRRRGKPALASKHAFAIIVSLGVNDALTATPVTKRVFAERYAALLAELSKLTTRLYVVEIPPVETRERLTADMQKEVMTTIRDFRSVLPEVATRANATYLALPEMAAPFTIDGIHLNAEGYRAWDQAVMQGTSQACGK